MPTEEDIAHQQELLAAHRRTLAQYLKQQALISELFTPPAISHGIDEARANIQRVKSTLSAWGIPIEDLPDDQTPPVVAPALVAKPPTSHTAAPITADCFSSCGPADCGISRRLGGRVGIPHTGTYCSATGRLRLVAVRCCASVDSAGNDLARARCEHCARAACSGNWD